MTQVSSICMYAIHRLCLSLPPSLGPGTLRKSIKILLQPCHYYMIKVMDKWITRQYMAFSPSACLSQGTVFKVTNCILQFFRAVMHSAGSVTYFGCLLVLQERWQVSLWMDSCVPVMSVAPSCVVKFSLSCLSVNFSGSLLLLRESS